MFSRSEGNKDKVEGQAKHAFGDLTGDSNMSVRGQAQDVSGDAQKTVASLSEYAQSGLSSATGAASSFLSSVTGGSNYTSNNPSQTDGKADNIMGQAKEAVGNWTGDSGLAGRGQGQDVAGDAQQNVASLTDYIKDSANSTTGYVKNLASGFTGGNDYTTDAASHTDANIDKGLGNMKSSIGGMLGSSSLQGSGDAQHASGEAQSMAATVRQHIENAADGVQGRDSTLAQPDPWRAE